MEADKTLDKVREMVQACIQCGTCSGSCPNAFAMEHVPRKLWRMVLAGQTEEVLSSKTFVLCSSCYYCTLRCPRGLPLTQAMSALAQLSAKCHPDRFKQSHAFYHAFLTSVKAHGRVNETELMSAYFMKMKNPLLPLGFAGLGLKLLSKKKISMAGLAGASAGSQKLAYLFNKVDEMEQQI